MDCSIETNRSIPFTHPPPSLSQRFGSSEEKSGELTCKQTCVPGLRNQVLAYSFAVIHDDQIKTGANYQQGGPRKSNLGQAICIFHSLQFSTLKKKDGQLFIFIVAGVILG